MDDDCLLIPVTYQVNTKSSIEEDVAQVFALMKDPGALSGTLHSIIPAGVALLTSSLDEDGILNLNFSQEIEQLDAKDELRFLEATSYVFCQLDGINGVRYAKEGETLLSLPNGKITLSQPITSNLGINNFESSSNALHHTSPMLVYLAKNIGDEEFYVPVSKRIQDDASLDDQINDIIGEVSVSSTLHQASKLEKIELLDGSYLENGHLFVNLNAMVLLDETTIDQDVYDLLVLSFSSLQGVDDISIQVQGQDIDLPQSQKVSDIIYNVVKI